MRHRIAEGEDITKQIPFPPSDTTSGSTSAPKISGDGTPLRRATNTTGSVSDVVPREGVLMRFFSFLKHIGVDLVMPPYTVDDRLANIIPRDHGHTNLVSLHLARCFAAALIAHARFPGSCNKNPPHVNQCIL